MGITHFVVSASLQFSTFLLHQTQTFATVQTILPSLSVLQDLPELQRGLDTKYQRMHIKLDDLDHANLLLHMTAAVKYVQAAIAENGNVLVHCAAGISRSATVGISRSPYCSMWEKTARDSDLGTPTVVLHWHLQSFVLNTKLTTMS